MCRGRIPPVCFGSADGGHSLGFQVEILEALKITDIQCGEFLPPAHGGRSDLAVGMIAAFPSGAVEVQPP